MLHSSSIYKNWSKPTLVVSLIAKKESEKFSASSVDIGLASMRIELQGMKLDAQASFEKNSIRMWGFYNGMDFKMTLRPNGYVWFDLNHKRFSHPINSSTPAQFRQFLNQTRADQEEVRKIFFGLWSDYNSKISDKTLVNEKIPYNQIGHFNYYLDSTIGFGESIQGARVIIEGNAGTHPT